MSRPSNQNDVASETIWANATEWQISSIFPDTKHTVLIHTGINKAVVCDLLYDSCFMQFWSWHQGGCLWEQTLQVSLMWLSIRHPQILPNCKSRPFLLSHPSLSNAVMAWAFPALTRHYLVKRGVQSWWKYLEKDISHAAARLWPGKPISREREGKTLQTETNYFTPGDGAQPHIYWYQQYTINCQ